MNIRVLMPALSVVILSACVNPERVSETKVTDSNISCQGIADELSQINAIRAEAEKGTGASGRNIAAVLLFWPAAIGNYANASEALEAAEKREARLVQLAEAKNCNITSQ